ncbi:MAG: acyl-CoA/acyl-ACP dehydrogenase [Burkholderiaceae bacterium]|nr:acyl-CoA/acyl-ACP dehydrogenase [Burkholderiaceae bacterium]
MKPAFAASPIDAADSLERRMADALRDAPRVDRAGRFPVEWWQHLAAQSLLGLSFDLDGRGPRAGWPSIARLSGLIARETGSLGLALGWLLHEMLGRFVIGPNVRAEGHRALLRMMASGQRIVGLAISEPDAGAHPKRLRCTARRDRESGGDGWLLDGSKSWVSNGPAAGAFVVLAVTGENDGRKTFDAFVVERGEVGLQVQDASGAALAPLGHASLRLEACAVPDALRLDTGGEAFARIARPVRIVEDALLAAAMSGAMQAELDALAAWLRGTRASAATTRRLGALQLELAALRPLADESARHLERRGPDDDLARLNAGARILFERWQAGFEAFAATLDDLGDGLHRIAADMRTVLSIARGVGEARQLDAGSALLQSKDPHEVAA